MECLIVKKKWLDLILDGDEDGQKDLEIRGCRCNKVGTVYLAESGTGMIVGRTDILISDKITESEFEVNLKRHKIQMKFSELPYKTPYKWMLYDSQRLPVPVPYNHPQGAVIWVKLPDDKFMTTELCPICGSEVDIPAYGISSCPECGNRMMPCSMCEECITECPYEEGK